MMPLGGERSRWLGELAQAVDDARHLLWELGSTIGLSTEALDLHARLEVVRAELEEIRRARRPVEFAPLWTGFCSPHPSERIAR
jgi:hypothetical protein